MRAVPRSRATVLPAGKLASLLRATLIGISGAALIACTMKSPPSTDPSGATPQTRASTVEPGAAAATPSPTAQVQTVAIRRGPIEQTVQLAGQVVAVKELPVAASAATQVGRVLVMPGQTVTQGQTLIEPAGGDRRQELADAQRQELAADARAKAAYRQIESRVRLATAEADQLQRTTSDGLAADLLLAQSTILQAQADVQRAEADLARLTAPPPETEIRAADQEVRAAELELRRAEADHERLLSGPTEAEIRRAEADVALAEGRVRQATEVLTRLTNSSSSPQVQAAEQAVRLAQENLQAARETPSEIISAQLLVASARGRSEREREAIRALARQQVENARAQQLVRIERAEADLKRAVDNLSALRREPDSAQVEVAKRDFETALQGLGEARERLTAVKNGPTQAEIDASEAVVDRATVALERARSRRAALDAGPPADLLRTTQAAVTTARAALRAAEGNRTELQARQEQQAQALSAARAEIATLQPILDGQANLAELAAKPDADPDIVELAQTQGDLERAQSRLAQLTRDAATAPLVAPAAGIVTAIQTGSGESIDPSRPALVMVRVEDLVVQADVPEVSGSLIAEGQTARVRTPPTASTDLSGTVARVTAANGSKTVQLAMSWAAPLPAPGTEAQVVIQIGRKEQALLVPLSAIQMVDGKPHVTVVAGGEQRRLAVLTGLRNDREIEITVGPSEGQLVLVGQR